MITIRTMKQIATSRTIPSFRSTPHLGQWRSGVAAQPFADQGRMTMGYAQMLDREILRQQRDRVWKTRLIEQLPQS